MSDTGKNDGATPASNDVALPSVTVPRANTGIDITTTLGLLLTFGLIAGAILMGQSNASFINIPSLMIVLFGTMTATCVSFTMDEISRSWRLIAKSTTQTKRDLSGIAYQLISLAVIAKKKGILGLSIYENETRKEPFIAESLQMAVDGYNAEQIEKVLSHKIEAQVERHKRSASITKRASEIAPAMGLIGTLVGLVQMLADLENPESIGPAMALALLTTFYGAILGTIVMAPITAKLEKNSADESLFQVLVMTTAVSIAKQDNPRSLEMQLNSELSPLDRITYFD